MRFGYVLAAGAALIVGVPVNAATITGTIDIAAGQSSIIFLPISGTGNYAVFGTTTGASSSFLTVGSEYKYNYYRIDTGQYVGGNEMGSFPMPVADGSDFSTFIQWERNVDRISYDNGFIVRELGAYTYSVYVNMYSNGSPINYSYTVDYMGAVPEPASWVLLIAGFGLIGGAMRRRKQPPRANRALPPVSLRGTSAGRLNEGL